MYVVSSGYEYIKIHVFLRLVAVFEQSGLDLLDAKTPTFI